MTENTINITRRCLGIGLLITAALLTTATAAENVLSSKAGTLITSLSSQLQLHGGGAAAAMIDEDLQTRWTSAENTWTHDFSFDLGSSQTIERIVLDNSANQESEYPGISARSVAVLARPENSDTDIVLAYGEVEQGGRTEFVLPTPLATQTIKLTIISNWGYAGQTQLTEIEAYGSSTSSIVAPSTTNTEPEQGNCQGTACSPTPDEDETQDVFWQGFVNIMQFGPLLYGDGDIRTHWNVSLNLREVKRIDVRNQYNQRVGQFILLEDNGSNWQGHRLGRTDNQTECGHRWAIYQGQGAGSNAVQFGWIYVSFSNDDPLSDVLPNGSYFIRSTSDQFVQGTVDYHSINCEGEYRHNQQADKGMSLAFMLGRQFVHPLDTGQRFISAEAFADLIRQSEPHRQSAVRIMDSDQRQVSDDTMSGRYQSVGAANNDGLYWIVDWAISHDSDIQYTER